jgi:2-amino-4-hydroxy-6-hydroxymethyldihydropteridine diphosphokinase
LISFGANIGQPADTIAQAAEQLQTRLALGLRQFQLSRLFRTPAVGGPRGQPPFVNAVAALDVEGTSPWDVWHAVRDIEHALGRVRMERWEARRIDLDVLMFDQQRIWTQHFKLPHPRMVMRRFILEPALDVAAQWQEPVTGLTIFQLATRLRSGPASVALVTSDLPQGQLLLERAAAQSGCQWLTPTVVDRTAAGATHSFQPSTGRWLGLVSRRALEPLRSATLEPAPKLVFVLADPVKAIGAAWEDFHRPLAAWLGLSGDDNLPDNHPSRCWPLAGPRYLLASDDPAWAEHEIVAALEAMDCPVEAAD